MVPLHAIVQDGDSHAFPTVTYNKDTTPTRMDMECCLYRMRMTRWRPTQIPRFFHIHIKIPSPVEIPLSGPFFVGKPENKTLLYLVWLSIKILHLKMYIKEPSHCVFWDTILVFSCILNYWAWRPTWSKKKKELIQCSWKPSCAHR